MKNNITLFALILVGLTGSAFAYPGPPDKYEHPRMAHTAGAPNSNSNAGTELSLPTLTDQYGAPGVGTMPQLIVNTRETHYWMSESPYGYLFDQRMCLWYRDIHATPPAPIIEFHAQLEGLDEIKVTYAPSTDKITVDYDGQNHILVRALPVTKASLTSTADAWTYGAHQWTSGVYRISMDHMPVSGLAKVAFTKGSDPANGDHGILKWNMVFRPDPQFQHTWVNLTGDVEAGSPANTISGSEPEALDRSSLIEDAYTGDPTPMHIVDMFFQNVASCQPTTAANGAL